MDERTRQSFIARQPIFNPDLSLHGYELLFRHGRTGSAQFEDANRATSQVIVGAYLDHGLENIVGSLPAFINVGSEFFRGNYPLPMRTEQVVLEVLESVPPEPEIVEALRQLKAQDYRIALDHFVYREALEPLLALADYIKLDTLALDEAALTLEVDHVRRHSKAKLIAAKVETEALHALCTRLGFDYYQGYFFSRPEVVESQAAKHNRVLILKLLTQLQQEETEPGDLEQIIVRDVALSYRLLRYINCATFALRREVDSIRQAILLLGLDAIRKWATLLLLGQHQRQPAARPDGDGYGAGADVPEAGRGGGGTGPAAGLHRRPVLGCRRHHGPAHEQPARSGAAGGADQTRPGQRRGPHRPSAAIGHRLRGGRLGKAGTVGGGCRALQRGLPGGDPLGRRERPPYCRPPERRPARHRGGLNRRRGACPRRSPSWPEAPSPPAPHENARSFPPPACRSRH